MKARIVFLLKLKPGSHDDFLKAYEDVRQLVAGGVDGHIVDQVCQSRDDPDQWLITSEWDSLDQFLEWEKTPGHREIAAPMMQCVEERESLKFEVKEETRA